MLHHLKIRTMYIYIKYHFISSFELFSKENKRKISVKIIFFFTSYTFVLYICIKKK